MPRLIFLGVVIITLSGSMIAQSAPRSGLALDRVDLVSPWDHSNGKAVYVQSRYRRNCLDLLRLIQRCDATELLHYGNRSGVNWDIFSVSGGRDSRSRMIDLGEHDWTDRFTIPEVEPWPALNEGETRTIIVNTSGADGRDGEPGKNGANADGTVSVEPPRPTPAPKRPKQTIDYGRAPLSVQVSSTITVRGKAPVASSYNPFTEAKKGHMYLIRVMDRENDYYILLRVDELVRGEKAGISYFRLPPAL